MTKMTYHIESSKDDDECIECGRPATILLVADSHDDVGYVDEVPLCEDCAEERQV